MAVYKKDTNEFIGEAGIIGHNHNANRCEVGYNLLLQYWNQGLLYLYNLLGKELPMGIFNRMKEPVFLKENSNAEVQLAHLRELEPLLNLEGKSKIRQDIKYLEYGIAGEKNVAFELSSPS